MATQGVEKKNKKNYHIISNIIVLIIKINGTQWYTTSFK